MTTKTKALLGIGVVSLVAGFGLNGPWLHFQNHAASLYALLPVGATFLGLGLLSKVFEKESAAYDLEHSSGHSKENPPTPRIENQGSRLQG